MSDLINDPNPNLISTSRLTLEPVTLAHAQELYELLGDPDLHRHVEFEVPTYEEQLARCRRWSAPRSPDGSECWYNWVARETATSLVVGSFQAALRPNGAASLGYLVRRASQGRGFATEVVLTVLAFLRAHGAQRVEISVTADNLPSIRVAEKIGMKRALVISGGALIKGVRRDEVLYSMEL